MLGEHQHQVSAWGFQSAFFSQLAKSADLINRAGHDRTSDVSTSSSG